MRPLSAVTINSIMTEQNRNFPMFMYPTVNHIYNEKTGKKETLASLLKGPQHERWYRALSNELGRLADGNKYGVEGTNTIRFIQQSDVPSNKTVTYANFVCDHRPLKAEPWRVRCVAGGDKLPYADDPSAPAANMLDTKLCVGDHTICPSNPRSHKT